MTRPQISKTNFDIYCWFIQVAVVITLSCLVIWRSLVPKRPNFTTTDIFIPTSLDQNSTLPQNATFHNISLIFNFKITNRNKGIGIYYDNIYLTLFCSNFVVGTNSMPSFYQGHKDVTLLEVLISVDHKLCIGVPTGPIDLKVSAKTAVIYEYTIFRCKTRHRRLAYEGYVGLSQNGSITGKNIELHRTVK